MNYPAPNYAVPAPLIKPQIKIAIIVVVCVLILGFILLVAVGVALGVGLGIGLSKGSNSNSASSSDTSTSLYSILSAPTVTCTYNGSATCGCSATSPSFLTPRILQGYTAVANSWPWMVALYINNGQVFCGGFLVTYQHVITAAHCVYGQTTGGIIVYGGLQTLSSRSSSQSRGVASFVVHSGYSTTDYTNDIAILTLQSAFNQTTLVGKCCLSYDTSLPSVNEHAVIAGWGVISAGSTTASNNLLQGVVQVQGSTSTCGTQSSIEICAGYSGTDACYGDSGSPLMTSVSNSWTCTGLVSHGQSCGTATTYTRVTAYQSFITGIIGG